MKLTRRQVIGLGALTLYPGFVFGGENESGEHVFLSAASEPDDRHWLTIFRIDKDNALISLSRHALPSRGHHVAAHSASGLYAVVARRPGNWLLFGDFSQDRQLLRVDAPDGRHFLGHGVFSVDGLRFYAVENNYQVLNGDSGRVSVWDIRREGLSLSVSRQGDFATHGIGPHELALMPDGKTLVVANGGIRTHPDSDREKLNIDTMQPSLAYFDVETGRLLEQRQMEPEFHQASIRHLDVNAEGLVALVMQHEGLPFEDVPLVALHQRGNELQYPVIPLPEQQQMQQYCGSVRFDQSGRFLAVSCPRGNRITFWDALAGEFIDSVRSRDGCGVCAVEQGFLYTAGTGRISLFDLVTRVPLNIVEDTAHPLFWDNHLTVVPA